MIELLILAFIWWLIGAAMFLHVCYLLDPVIRVRDVLVATLAGIFGPFGILYYLYAPDRRGLLDIVVYRKK